MSLAGEGPVDPDFIDFLCRRVGEDIDAAEQRRARSGRADQPEDAGLRMLREVFVDLRAGRSPDPMSLRMLTLAHDRHPDFRREWSPWSR